MAPWRPANLPVCAPPQDWNGNTLLYVGIGVATAVAIAIGVSRDSNPATAAVVPTGSTA